MKCKNVEGKRLFDLEIDEIFSKAFKKVSPPDVVVREVDAHINEPQFAQALMSVFRDLRRRK